MDDVALITQLVLRERHGRDHGHWDRMRDAWRPDGKVRISWMNGTAEDFIAASMAMTARGTRATHRMSPPIVDVIDDRAIVDAAAIIEARTTLGGVEVDLASRVRLLFRVQRGDQGWQLVAMTCVYESDSITPLYPGCVPDLTRADVDARRPSYRWLAAALHEAGHEVPDDMPGADRPRSVESVERAERRWLHGSAAVAVHNAQLYLHETTE